MTGGAAYRIRRARIADLPLLNAWVARPQVARWWVDGAGIVQGFDESDLSEPDVRMWIVSLGDRPFAYIQDYDPHATPGHHFADRPPGTRGIDQFIGEPDLLGQGHGSALVRAHADALLRDGAPMVVTDPDPTNARAVRAYQKAGFAPYGTFDSPEWGRLLLMSKARP